MWGQAYAYKVAEKIAREEEAKRAAKRKKESTGDSFHVKRVNAEKPATREVSSSSSPTSIRSGLFGRKQSSPPEQKDLMQEAKRQVEHSLAVLRQAIDSQEDRERVLGQQILESIADAKKKLHYEHNKRGAVRAMKRVKKLQLEQEKISAAIDKMETMMITIDSSLNNLPIMEAIRAGNTAMKNIQGDKTFDKLDDLLRDIRDKVQVQQEIQQLLTAPVQNLITEDDDDLLRELQMLGDGQKEARPQPMNIGSLMQDEFPAVPPGVVATCFTSESIPKAELS